MPRRISGLIWAHACARPSCIPVGRPRGVKASGLRYETALQGQIPGSIRGQWFQFCDRNGLGYCQTDLLMGWEGHACVLECKYSWTQEGHDQLEFLYLPVVREAVQRPVLGLQVCRRLVPAVAQAGVQVCSSLEEALHGSASGRRTAWHWLAQGQQLGPSSRSATTRHAVLLDTPLAAL